MMVDDHEMVIQGLTAILDSQPEIEIVGTFTNGLVAADEFLSLQPDITLMDIHMPIVNGFETVELIRKKDENSRIIMLSMEVKNPYVTKAIDLGVKGYVSKNAPINDLISAIKTVHSGGESFPMMTVD
jgi:DNA-binding NarL/FixJ family response regulator